MAPSLESCALCSELAAVFHTMVVAFAGATVQTVTGFGFALIAVPSLVLLLPVREAIVVASLLGLGNAVLVVLSTRGHADQATIVRLLAGSVAGMPLGLAILLLLSQDTLRIAVGATTVAMVLAMGRGLRISRVSPGTDGAIGILCGLLSTSTGMNGPPLVLYLQSRGLAPIAFRATLSRFFVASGLLSQVAFGAGGVLDRRALLLAAAGVPAALAGHQLGDRIVARLSPVTFRRVVLCVLASAAALGATAALTRFIV